MFVARGDAGDVAPVLADATLLGHEEAVERGVEVPVRPHLFLAHFLSVDEDLDPFKERRRPERSLEEDARIVGLGLHKEPGDANVGSRVGDGCRGRHEGCVGVRGCEDGDEGVDAKPERESGQRAASGSGAAWRSRLYYF